MFQLKPLRGFAAEPPPAPKGRRGTSARLRKQVDDLVGAQTRYAVLADYAATCFLSSSCRCRAIQWMALGRELDRSEIRARASETSSNDALSCCWSSSRRGLLETTTKGASSCCLSAILASSASQYSQGMSWLTSSRSVSEFCALYRSGSGSIGMVSGWPGMVTFGAQIVLLTFQYSPQPSY